jgi:N,N-dimethylformamidase
MEVLGYSDRLSLRAGERVQFMVSCEREEYSAEIVRLDRAWPVHDPDSWSPHVIQSPVAGGYPGRVQPIHAGSYVEIPAAGLEFAAGVTVHLWLYPTLPARGRESGIVSRANGADLTGFSLALDAAGNLIWRVGNGEAETALASPYPLIRNRWYEITASASAGSGASRLAWRELPRGWVRGAPAATLVGEGSFVDARGPLLLAASSLTDGRPEGLFNGKIDRPALWPRVLSPAELATLSAGEPASSIPGLIADWDPVVDYRSRRLVDRSVADLHGRLVNLPTRLVTGANWRGEDTSFKVVPGQYGAIHFHEDDLEDCGWEVDFAFDVPADLPSGIYAARLTAGATVEHIPFYVRPAAAAPTSRILYLGPTNTYLAYANEKLFRMLDTEPELIAKMTMHATAPGPVDEYLRSRPELAASTYDRHEDGAGYHYSTRLRPVLTMRPDFATWMTGELRHFSGDLYLVEWLERLGFDYDVATDEDLHLDGVAALAPYSVIVTGGHPEYWTAPMMDAVEAYLAGGGKMLYLGGNGFYWVTGMDRDYPHVVEIRRGYNGTRSWESPPGEAYLTTSGEPGGLWRYRGRNPNRLTGIGFTAQGWGGAAGYARRPESRDPRYAWIFAGIGDDEIIGEFGHVMGGAAGDEIDRFDLDFGTPVETVWLATSQGRQSDYYQWVLEDQNFGLAGTGGQGEPRVRSDITLLELPGGGTVFSAGSITFNASLTWNECDNNVSRLTANVLRRFAG